jgi:cyclase
LKDGALVKTVKFKDPAYIGDPINTVRIFNELEVDELIFLDILSSKRQAPPNFKVLTEIADECFMPLCYGGGLRDLEDLVVIYNIGFEKVAINTHAAEDPSFISRAADRFGSQSIIVSMDVKKNLWGKYEVMTLGGTRNLKADPIEYAVRMEKAGAGEILLTSIDREGTWSGFDLDLVRKIATSVTIPVIAHGGAGSVAHIGQAVQQGCASAVALGSMVVYQSKGMGVLINFPDRGELSAQIGRD